MNEAKFNGMGKIYAKFRPAYPEEFIEYLYSDIGMDKSSVIADIGSGTGIFTKQLLEKGSHVFAVEPNKDMRAVAELDLIDFDNFTSVNGSDKNTTLADNSFDFITVAQAFHWFDRSSFKKECSRILKPNGKVILVWNSIDLNADPVKDGATVHKKYCSEFKNFSGGLRVANGHEFCDFFSGEYESRFFQNDLIFDIDSYIGRSLSASYALKEDDVNYSAYVAELTKNFDKYAIDGKLTTANITKSFVGTVKIF